MMETEAYVFQQFEGSGKMAVFGYGRVSTADQTNANQRLEIERAGYTDASVRTDPPPRRRADLGWRQRCPRAARTNAEKRSSAETPPSKGPGKKTTRD